jgi:hypothetical protein
MMRLLRAIRAYFSLGIIMKLPSGITADPSALYGLLGLISNANNYAESIANVTTAGTNTPVTPAQILSGMLVMAAGASGGFTITLPATSAILAALGPTIPTDGTYAEPCHIVNNGVGQTGTVTAGDANTTLTGTMTIATNTTRKFILTVTSPTTISIQNVGSWGL